MNLSFDEIKDFDQFEELVIAYFESLKKENIQIKVKASGVGTDGGRDILVEIVVDDNLVSFKRTWIVQCKFHNRNVSTNEVSDINIPSLIHSYKGSGYLLILKKRPTSKLTEHFERLTEKCRFDYHYEIWSGEKFINNIYNKGDKNLWQQFFPNYFTWANENQ